MSDTLYSGRRFRVFTLMDDFNREALAVEVDTSLPAERIVRVLDQVVAWRGAPERLRLDNGPEFLASAFAEWAEARGIELTYIQPGKPVQNAYIERFNGTYHREPLDLYVFTSLGDLAPEVNLTAHNRLPSSPLALSPQRGIGQPHLQVTARTSPGVRRWLEVGNDLPNLTSNARLTTVPVLYLAGDTWPAENDPKVLPRPPGNF